MYEMFKEIRDGITDEQEKRDYLKGQKRIEKMSASRKKNGILKVGKLSGYGARAISAC